MASWGAFEQAEPAFAGRVRQLFELGRHEEPDGELFVADITEVVITHLDAEATTLVIESWTPARGLRTVERD